MTRLAAAVGVALTVIGLLAGWVLAAWAERLTPR